MEKLKYIFASLLLVAGFAACSSEDDDDVNSTDSSSTDVPVLVSTSPADGETDVDPSITSITLTFDRNIGFASSNASKITLNGTSVSKAVVSGTSPTLTITVSLDLGTSYTLNVPSGLISGPSGDYADAVTISFSTVDVDIDTELSNSSATDATVTLWKKLLGSYGTEIYSGMMCNTNWNYEYSTRVYSWTGSYPAINGYDYLHIEWSPANWIDYTDISPVQEWYDAGGIVTCGWHWNVPNTETSTDVSDMSFYTSGTDFSVGNALVDGTWENGVMWEDLELVADHLELLLDADIPVLWRPLHEASGGWFWWGAEDAEDYVELWQTMYDYFIERGLNNLIWVWTSCEGTDTDWYPGDDYVDIIGTDLYSMSDASEIYSLYCTLMKNYPNKMLTLSECGSIATIEEQWEAGCKWLWFMPWGDGTNDDGSTLYHADSTWWSNAMSLDYVVKR